MATVRPLNMPSTKLEMPNSEKISCFAALWRELISLAFKPKLNAGVMESNVDGVQYSDRAAVFHDRGPDHHRFTQDNSKPPVDVTSHSVMLSFLSFYASIVPALFPESLPGCSAAAVRTLHPLRHIAC